MESLPNEIIERILAHPNLSIADVVSFSSTCSKFRLLIDSNNNLWRAKYFQCWPSDDFDIVSNDWHKETRTRKMFEKEIMEILSLMDTKFYHLQYKNISGHHLKFILPLLNSHTYGYYYIKDFLIYINSFPPTQMLTNKYYGTILLKFINKIRFPLIWNGLLNLKKEEQTLEKGLIAISEWQQIYKTGIEKYVVSELDRLANLVKCKLLRNVKDHPLKYVSKETRALWSRENIPDNMFDFESCKLILQAINVVLFNDLKFQLSKNLKEYQVGECGIDNALMDRRAPQLIFAIIYESVARRLGVKTEVLDCWNRCFLRWKSLYNQELSSTIYIDLNLEGLFTTSLCRMCIPNVEIEPNNMQEVAQKVTNYMYANERRNNSPCKMELLELFLVFEPHNLEHYEQLSHAHMMQDMDVSELITKLQLMRLEVKADDLRNFQGLLNCLEIYQDNWLEYDRTPRVVTKHRKRKIAFAVGMIVQEKFILWPGVIVGWEIGEDREGVPDSGEVFYELLSKNGTVGIFLEENLEIHQTPPFTFHPFIGRFFDEYCMTYYKPGKQLQAEYPDDMKALIKILKKERKI